MGGLGFGFFFVLELLYQVYMLAEAGNHCVQYGKQSEQAARPKAINYYFNFLVYGFSSTPDQ